MQILLSTSITSAFLQFQLVCPTPLVAHISRNMSVCLFMSPPSEGIMVHPERQECHWQVDYSHSNVSITQRQKMAQVEAA